jgi:uncharacterized repeat protein (TIGR01451 family)
MKKLIILLAVAMVVGFAGSLMAVGTSNTVWITNRASVDAGNIASVIVSEKVSNQVLQIIGAQYVTIPADANGNNNQTVPFEFNIQNVGNDDDQFNITVFSRQSNFVPESWTISTSPVTTPILGPGATTTFTLYVTVPNGATNASYAEYQIRAQSASLGPAVGKTNQYTGDNSTVYGGDMGISVANYLTHNVVNQSAAATNMWVRVTVTGPILGISKSVSSILLGGAASPVVPGATISYHLRVSNTGVGPANSVDIRDVIPNNTTFTGVVHGIAGPAGSVDESTVAEVRVTNTSLGVYAGVADVIAIDYRVTVD